jgi:lipopolysaccharide/colanic/teichoic acid biosynthesis glycosyltransferase
MLEQSNLRKRTEGINVSVSTVILPSAKVAPKAAAPAAAARSAAESMASFVSEEEFRRMLCRERKRSERSRKHLLLMLVDFKRSTSRVADKPMLEKVAAAVASEIRETDLAGWFENDAVIGAIFTELGDAQAADAITTIEAKISAGLHKSFKREMVDKLQIAFYAFPDSWAGDGTGRSVSAPLYPDLLEEEEKKKTSLVIKRAMDIVGSGMALLAFSPIFLVLSLLVKLSSKGPVFFRQARVSQYGKHFTFLKFRSMRVSNNDTIHKDYVKSFIAGKADSATDGQKHGQKAPVYKITNDPRVTAIGRFMRRTSLDELPQFWNVFIGEMSLVGPRPPIPYELEAYDVWHRRRLLEVKPGITGLWQVRGRSSTTFDEMVRLDLQYSRTWSPMLDVKILLDTPRAVLMGDGAY